MKTALLVPLALAAATAASAAEPVYYTNAPKDVIAQVADLATVAKVRFFSSADAAKSWQLVKEIPVAEGAKTPPRLEFRPPADGSYIIATCAVYKKTSPEPDPKPGSVPANALYLTVDTIKPAIGQSGAKLERAGEGKAVVAVTWTATDGNLGAQPVVLEASADGGATWPLSFPGPAQGAASITVPTPRSARAVQVRIGVKDLAGNAATSAPISVELPPPPDPKTELEKAVSSLPPVDDLQPASRPAAPATDGTATATTPTGTTASPGKPAPLEPATASADPMRPDVIAPNASETALLEPADGGLIERSDATPPPAAPGPSFKPNERPRPVAEAEPEPEESEAAAGEPAFLPNPGAEIELERARQKARAGDRDGAMAMYRRLHRSGQAPAAIADELALLQEMGDHRRVVETVESLPPEYIGDAARLRQGRALVALGEHVEALRALARVRAGAAEAREAMWLIARCFQSQGRDAKARSVLETLAKGSDEWATRAQEQLR